MLSLKTVLFFEQTHLDAGLLILIFLLLLQPLCRVDDVAFQLGYTFLELLSAHLVLVLPFFTAVEFLLLLFLVGLLSHLSHLDVVDAFVEGVHPFLVRPADLLQLSDFLQAVVFLRAQTHQLCGQFVFGLLVLLKHLLEVVFLAFVPELDVLLEFLSLPFQ